MGNPAGGAPSPRSAAGRAVIAAAVLVGALSGCSGGSAPTAMHANAISRPPAPASGPAGGPAGSGPALNLTGLTAVRPCPGIPR